MTRNMEGLEKSITQLEAQINEAKKRGMDAFDSDRLLVSRKEKK